MLFIFNKHNALHIAWNGNTPSNDRKAARSDNRAALRFGPYGFIRTLSAG